MTTNLSKIHVSVLNRLKNETIEKRIKYLQERFKFTNKQAMEIHSMWVDTYLD